MSKTARDRDIERLMFSLYHEPMPDYDWTDGKIKEIVTKAVAEERKECAYRVAMFPIELYKSRTALRSAIALAIRKRGKVT